MTSTENTGNYALTVDCIEENLDDSSDPVIAAIVKHWNSVRGSALAPTWASWDWMEIPPRAIRHCGVVDVVGTPEALDFVYRFWGGAHASASKLELTGKSVMAMRPEEEADQVFSQYRVCYERRQPCLFNVNYWYEAMDVAIGERSLRLPFVADDGETISHLLAYSYISGDTESVRRILVDSTAHNAEN